MVGVWYSLVIRANWQAMFYNGEVRVGYTASVTDLSFFRSFRVRMNITQVLVYLKIEGCALVLEKKRCDRGFENVSKS